jgi:SAM-dependent methyltransferase
MHDASAWRRFFPDEPFHMDAFRRAVHDLALPGATILDLGCGDNRSFADLRSVGRVVWGTDFQRHPQLGEPEWFRPLPPDGTIPFADDSFDLVTAVWVLEHVVDPVHFLREVRRVLRPGGTFVGHSVNGRHYVALIRRAFDLLPHAAAQWIVHRLYGRPPHDTFPTRYRLNTRFQMEQAARTAGLAVRGLRYFADPGYFSFNRLASRAAIAADWALESLCPGWGRIYFTVTMQRPAAAEAQRSAA